MKDIVGNNLEKGNLVYWLKGEVIAHVLDVDEPRIETGGEQPSFITVAIRFPVFRQKGESTPILGGFLRVIDPSQQDAVERVAGVAGPSLIKRPS